eukprot:9477468-Karenia_brevis.AAC.1
MQTRNAVAGPSSAGLHDAPAFLTILFCCCSNRGEQSEQSNKSETTPFWTINFEELARGSD